MAEHAHPWRSIMGPVGPAVGAVVLALAGAGALVIARQTRRRSGTGRAVIMGAIAFDLIGGAVSFQLTATRAHYAKHTPAARMGFAAAHVHPLALPLLGEGGWARAIARYATAVVATAALGRGNADSRGRRGAALVLSLVLSDVDAVTDRSNQRWFGPVYLIKLVGGHASVGAAPIALDASAPDART